MPTVRMIIKNNDRPSKEQIDAIKEAESKEIVFDEDSPEMTEEMLKKFKRVYNETEDRGTVLLS